MSVVFDLTDLTWRTGNQFALPDWHNFSKFAFSTFRAYPELSMMNAVMRTTMRRIRFTDAAAQAIVDDQGIDALEEVKLISDDEIESLGKVLRRPGGMIAGVGDAPAVQNPGVQVNQRAEDHLKMMSFYLHHQVRVSRVVQAPESRSIRSVPSVSSASSNRRTRSHRVIYLRLTPRIGQR